MQRVFIGLGGNVGDSMAVLAKAIKSIGALPNTVWRASSSFYQTPAWGLEQQADFINAALEVSCALAPEQLLTHLLEIERQYGRDRQHETRWGPRVLDCDILLYGQQRIQQQDLQIPHAHMAQRAFVLQPLLELDAQLHIPGLGFVRDLLAQLPEPYFIQRF